MVPGAVFMLLLILVLSHFQREQNPALQLAFKAQRVDLVSRMQLGLSSASEAEKSAVMAITDQESETYADQARAATAEVERERREIGGTPEDGRHSGERDCLPSFPKPLPNFNELTTSCSTWRSEYQPQGIQPGIRPGRRKHSTR